jgi:hypothetical protein
MPWPQSGRTQYEETNKQTIQNENTKTQTQYLRLKNVVLSPAAKETTFFSGEPKGKNPFSRVVFCVLRARLAAGKGLGQDEYFSQVHGLSGSTRNFSLRFRKEWI